MSLSYWLNLFHSKARCFFSRFNWSITAWWWGEDGVTGRNDVVMLGLQNERRKKELLKIW